MKLIFSKSEVKQIKRGITQIEDYLIATGDLRAENRTTIEELKKQVKDNAIVKYKFLSGEVTVEFKEELFVELLSEYNDLAYRILPLVSTVIPALKGMFGLMDISFNKVTAIVDKHIKLEDEPVQQPSPFSTILDSNEEVAVSDEQSSEESKPF